MTVTGGRVVAQPNDGDFTLTGFGFSLSGTTPGGFDSSMWECRPCQPGDRLNLGISSISHNQFATSGPGEFQNVEYANTYLLGHFTFTGPDVSSAVLGTGATALGAPFSFRGELLNYGTVDNLEAGGFPVFIAELSGSGWATAHFSGPVGDPGLFTAENITYDFAPAASPTPEPASLLLLAPAAGWMLTRRRGRP